MHIDNKQFAVLFTDQQLRERIEHMGLELTREFGNKNPLFVIVLNGAFIFAADLLRQFNGECELYFSRIRSYSGMQSQELLDLTGFDARLTNRHIIIIEDIIDTGKTLSHLLDSISEFDPASITIAALLRKNIRRDRNFENALIGFDIGNRFVIGYGLDHNGTGRNLNAVWVLTED